MQIAATIARWLSSRWRAVRWLKSGKRAVTQINCDQGSRSVRGNSLLIKLRQVLHRQTLRLIVIDPELCIVLRDQVRKALHRGR